MTIKITPMPDIEMSQAEYERLLPEYNASQQYTTRPISFETWYRGMKNLSKFAKLLNK